MTVLEAVYCIVLLSAVMLWPLPPVEGERGGRFERQLYRWGILIKKK